MRFNLAVYLGLILVFCTVSALANQTGNLSDNGVPVFLGQSDDFSDLLSNALVDNDSVLSVESEIIEEPVFVTKKEKVKDAVKVHKEKVNKVTEDYLDSVEDFKEKRKYLIKYKEGFEKGEVNKDFSRLGVARVESDAEEVIDLLDDDLVDYVELEQEVGVLGEVVLSNIVRVSAPSVWNVTKGDGVNIAVLDTGVASHLDLNIAGGYSVVSEDYTDSNGHGTAMAGVASALLNNEGLVGVAPNANLYSVKIMENSVGELSDAIAGVEWAIDNEMDIVSMSFGMESYSQIFKEVLQDAYDSGILLVGASGNNGDDILYPAGYNSVIAVGAVDESDERADFSAYGEDLELVAPGVNINSTSITDYSVGQGTSYSTAHVAGVAALIWAYNNTLSNEQLRAKLQTDALDLGVEGKDLFYGYGLVQVNLEMQEYEVQNESYFYEIYNLSNYGGENEERIFWLNRTGTIDDVKFEEGYYLIKKYFDSYVKSLLLVIDEKGDVISQSIENPMTVLPVSDSYLGEGSNGTDFIVWAESGGEINFSQTGQQGSFDAYCINLDGGDYDICGYRDSTAKSDCEGATEGQAGPVDEFYNICGAESYGECNEDPDLDDIHSISNLQFQDNEDAKVLTYEDCAGSLQAGIGNKTYYVISQKRSFCLDSTSWKAEGNYGSWLKYSTQQCSAGQTCDSSKEKTTSTRNENINPCIDSGEICNGSIEVNTLDNDANPLSNSSIFINDVLNSSTDVNGQKIITTNNVACGVEYNITAKCENGYVCGTELVSIGSMNDTDPVSFDCTICLGKKDIYITKEDIRILSGGSEANVTATVHIKNISGSNLKVNFTVVNKDGSLGDSELYTFSSFSNNTDPKANVLLNFDSNSKEVAVYVDPKDDFKDDSKSNNFVRVPAVIIDVKAYLSIDTGNSILDEEIGNHFLNYVDNVSLGKEDVKVYVSVTGINPYVGSDPLYKNRWSIGSLGSLTINGKYINKDYQGFIASFEEDSDSIIYVVGAGKEGVLAAVKRLIDERNQFLISPNLGKDEFLVLNEYDTQALQIYSFMHNGENDDTVRFYSDEPKFRKIVTDILSFKLYESSIKLVTTAQDNVTLRLKYHAADPNYNQEVLDSPLPVVLSHGLHSNLDTWEDFAEDLSGNGFDTWVIEPYGGPGTECDNCTVYDFDDLKDSYWPALMAGVEAYSGQDNFSYVGYDLGCTVALESLETHAGGINDIGYYKPSGSWLLTDMSANPINTFVGIGCIGNFTLSEAYPNGYHSKKEYPYFTSYINNSKIYDSSSTYYKFFDGHLPGSYYKTRYFINDNTISPGGIMGWIATFTGAYYADAMYLVSLFATSTQPYPPSDSSKISMGVYKDLKEWMVDPNKPQPGLNVNLNNLAIIQGNWKYDSPDVTRDNQTIPQFRINTDEFVSTKDQLEICRNINSDNKYYVSFNNKNHFTNWAAKGLADDEEVKRVSTQFINSHMVNNKNTYEIISTNSNCD